MSIARAALRQGRGAAALASSRRRIALDIAAGLEIGSKRATLCVQLLHRYLQRYIHASGRTAEAHATLVATTLHAVLWHPAVVQRRRL
jgi:hypothetical protein